MDRQRDVGRAVRGRTALAVVSPARLRKPRDLRLPNCQWGSNRQAAPSSEATVWVRNTVDAALEIALRPVEAGANVLLVEPGDDWIFEGAMQRDGVRYAAPSLIAADLLTSPGRGPAEGEELITWMQANEAKWRQ